MKLFLSVFSECVFYIIRFICKIYLDKISAPALKYIIKKLMQISNPSLHSLSGNGDKGIW